MFEFGTELALLVKDTDGYCKKCDPSPPSSVEGTSLSNLLIGKSRLEDPWRSLDVFGFYIFIIHAGAEVLAARSHSSVGGEIVFILILDAVASITVALIYFTILFSLERYTKTSSEKLQ